MCAASHGRLIRTEKSKARRTTSAHHRTEFQSLVARPRKTEEPTFEDLRKAPPPPPTQGTRVASCVQVAPAVSTVPRHTAKLAPRRRPSPQFAPWRRWGHTGSMAGRPAASPTCPRTWVPRGPRGRLLLLGPQLSHHAVQLRPRPHRLQLLHGGRIKAGWLWTVQWGDPRGSGLRGNTQQEAQAVTYTGKAEPTAVPWPAARRRGSMQAKAAVSAAGAAGPRCACHQPGAPGTACSRAGGAGAEGRQCWR